MFSRMANRKLQACSSPQIANKTARYSAISHLRTLALLPSIPQPLKLVLFLAWNLIPFQRRAFRCISRRFPESPKVIPGTIHFQEVPDITHASSFDVKAFSTPDIFHKGTPKNGHSIIRSRWSNNEDIIVQLALFSVTLVLVHSKHTIAAQRTLHVYSYLISVSHTFSSYVS